MPKEKVLYVCDEKHNNRDVPLELEETVPYPENMQYGEKDSVHYYYQCPFCFKTYLAYQRMGKEATGLIVDYQIERYHFYFSVVTVSTILMVSSMLVRLKDSPSLLNSV